MQHPHIPRSQLHGHLLVASSSFSAPVFPVGLAGTAIGGSGEGWTSVVPEIVPVEAV
jgi:hypothetical protein